MQFLGKAIKEHGTNVKRLKLFFIRRSKEKKKISTQIISLLCLPNSTSCNPGFPTTFPIPTFICHCRLRISHIHFTQSLLTTCSWAMWCSAPAALLCFLAGCSRDISTLPYTLILCAQSTVTIILIVPDWPVSRLSLTLKGRWDERARAKSEAGGRIAQNYEPLFPMLFLFPMPCSGYFASTWLIMP